MRWGSFAAFVCAFGLVSACGDSDGGSDGSGASAGDTGDAGETGNSGGGSGVGGRGSGGTGSSAVPLSELPGELARTLCGVVETCFGSFLEIFPQPDCAANLENEFRNGDFSQLEAAIDAGRVEYDPAFAPACLRAFEELGCDVLSQRNFDVCEDAIRGTVPLGEACSIDAECAGPAFCALTGACPGVCAAPRAADETCTSDDECESGLNCDGLRCAARATAGQACEGPDAPDCQAGLVCAGATDTASGTCAGTGTLTARTEGQSCDLSGLQLCEPGLSCVFTGVVDAVPVYVCQAKAASGGACRLGFPEPCPDAEYCNDPTPFDAIAGSCEPLPGIEETCLPSTNRPLRCDVGLVCAGEVCTPRQANGGDCVEPIQCFSERCVAGRCEGPELCTAD